MAEELSVKKARLLREHHREWAKNRADELKARRICVTCGIRPAKHGKVNCEVCLGAARAKREAKKKVYGCRLCRGVGCHRKSSCEWAKGNVMDTLECFVVDNCGDTKKWYTKSTETLPGPGGSEACNEMQGLNAKRADFCSMIMKKFEDSTNWKAERTCLRTNFQIVTKG